MRKVIEVVKVSGVQIAKVTDMKGNLVRYQVEDPKLGRPNVGEFFTLRDARDFAGVAYNPPVKNTASKESYPEQQTGFSRKSARK